MVDGQQAAEHRKSADLVARKLAQLGLLRPVDFCLHLPLRYEDETTLTPLAAAPLNRAVQVEIAIISVTIQYRPRRQLLVLSQDEAGSELRLRFLNFYPNQIKQFEAAQASGQYLRAFGEIRQGFWGAEMVHPRVHVVRQDQPLPTTLTPVYPASAGLSQGILRQRIKVALISEALEETLPADWLEKLALWPLAKAVQFLHHPPAGVTEGLEMTDLPPHPAWARVKFDELLAQQLSLRKAYLARREHGSHPLCGKGVLEHALLRRLPFALTTAQQRVVNEITADLRAEYPMQRLLQGDVGSGKTIVAALAACHALEAGYQVAFMAPTEILAEQHFIKLREWLEPLGVDVIWLTGSIKKSRKQAAANALLTAEGKVQLVIGTHALIQTGVDFAKLGLVIVDEQHRFGVTQRLALRQKGQSPHQLMMSATPIPRTLAMSYFADLDVSVLDELPPGRTPVRTRLIGDGRRQDVMDFAVKRLQEGRQVYWVCPLIEESEVLDLQTAIDTQAALAQALPEWPIGLVHGRLKAEEKAAVMEQFVAGKIAVLVATTVIEVGVDVPNASLMIIEHAERFGLAQLHQLRGRVGRGQWVSDCILLYGAPLSATARERLKIIYENTDGFEIAQRDLHLRGPGEFVGNRQSGVPLLRYADLEADASWIPLARQMAETLLRDHPDIANQHLSRWLGSREDCLKV